MTPSRSPNRQLVVGTAGHIDHGKSQLVRALTGIDPDRLKEERERGITIDLGFARLLLEDGTRVGFVDVPGHERFVKNMLAGIGGIDLVLLVIAADESIKPQTVEHFDICRLLGIREGIIVLTKSDLVDRELLDLVSLEAREFVAGSFLQEAPIIPLSSRTGDGLDALREALAVAAERVPARKAGGLMRLPVDRSFSIRGFGSVVTGTLIAGDIREGDELAILPGGMTAKVRRLEVFNETTSIAYPGQRTAVNLQGVEAGAIERGDLLTVPGVLETWPLLDVEIDLLGTAAAPLKDLTRVRFHHGTVEAMARIKLLDRAALRPGTRTFGQIRLERPLAALPGDRFIIRRYSPAVTIGGGVILHNRPPKLRPGAAGAGKRFGRLVDASASVRFGVLIEEAGDRGIDAPALRSLTGIEADGIGEQLEKSIEREEIVSLPTTPPRYVDGSIYRTLTTRVIEALEAFHKRETLAGGLAREEIRTRLFGRSHPDVFRCLLADLVERKKIRTDRDRVALESHRIALSDEESTLIDQIESAYLDSGANPPELTGLAGRLGVPPRQAERLFHLLLSRGRLIRIQDGKVFHASAIEDLKNRLWKLRESNPIIEIAEFKDLSGTSRKNAIPLLQHFDQMRVTRREGNRRLILPPGPTAPSAN
ncbi:MAG: selenocysteine-specific translation elongation factor [Acidobacteria bacterium]|nr:selenocysteine-specific translation elongation factor [Acidobacteriota bacterium]